MKRVQHVLRQRCAVFRANVRESVILSFSFLCDMNETASFFTSSLLLLHFSSSLLYSLPDLLQYLILTSQISIQPLITLRKCCFHRISNTVFMLCVLLLSSRIGIFVSISRYSFCSLISTLSNNYHSLRSIFAYDVYERIC